MAMLKGVGEVPFSENGIANLLSMAKLVDDGFRIYCDTYIEDAIYVDTPNNGMRKFIRSKNCLYFHDTENRQHTTFFNSQIENEKLYKKRQI